MTRTRTIHRCSECGAAFPRWSGRCATCGEWNTLVEEIEEPPAAAAPLAPPGAAKAVDIGAVDLAAAEPFATGLVELDRVLGGGLVPGSVTLLAGEPGIGKSTLLLQVLAACARRGRRSMLVSGEESAQQVRRRAERIGAIAEGLTVLTTTDLAAVLAAVGAEGPTVLVVDSVQTLTDPAIGSAAGTVGQVRECAAALVRLAKATGLIVLLVGHVTKEGSIAGPKALEHVVDTVLEFEGERHHALRLLGATKHRFGPTGELGVFEMHEEGLVAVADPSMMLTGERRLGLAGSAVVPVLEGQRPILVEVQALVAPSPLPSPRRSAQGIPPGRLALLLAVLERRVGISFANSDVFVSVVGGLRVQEPALDLGLGLALISAVENVPIPQDIVACGEVGLAGEVRQVGRMVQRLSEACRLGFRRAIVGSCAPEPPAAVDLFRVATLAEAADLLSQVKTILRAVPG
jgi:DNA repair protein RadA/Sms